MWRLRAPIGRCFRDRADIAVFQDHLADPDAVIQRLLPFDVVCVMRERSPLPRNVIDAFLISSSLPRPDLETRRSMSPLRASMASQWFHTGYRSDPTIEFTWALILASARHIVTESNSVDPAAGSKQWARICVERPLAFWDLGGLDQRSRGLGALLE